MNTSNTEKASAKNEAGTRTPRVTQFFTELLFILPLIFMFVFFALPMLLTLVFSVFERTTFWMEPGFTLFAYENFFFSARLSNFFNSMYYSFISVVICFLLGFPIAVFVRKSVPQVAQHRVILLFILPFMVSEIIRVFALRPVLQRNGLVNETLQYFGLIDEPITSILYTHPGVVIGEVMSFLPFIVFSRMLLFPLQHQEFLLVAFLFSSTVLVSRLFPISLGDQVR